MKTRGFTLMELVILIAIMSIISLMTMVRLPSLEFFKSYGFSRVLISDINLTKVLSMTQNQRYRIVFGASSYQIQDQNGVAFLNPETNNATVNYPAGFTVSPTTTLVFDSLGQPYNAAGTTPLTTQFNLTVSSRGVTSMISITPQTGLLQ